MGFWPLVLSQIEDIGDLVGFPYKKVQMFHIVDGEVKEEWFSEAIAAIKKEQGWDYTGKIVTGYAEPQWLEYLKQFDKSILLVDDFTRADLRFQQALMQLIQDGTYYSWALPKNCTIVLTNNPDDGDYIVNAQDKAMSGRYCKFGVRFDIDDWTNWATSIGIDGRCINIMINGYREMLYSTDAVQRAAGKMDVSPRDWSNFFRFIAYLTNFSDKSALDDINRYGKAFVGDKIIMFTTAITQKMDILPSPEEILDFKKTDKEIEKMLVDACGSQKASGDKRYRPEIASVIAMRLQYHIIHEYKDKPFKEDFQERFHLICNSDSIGEELKMTMVSLLYENNAEKFTKLISLPRVKELLKSL